MKWDIFSDRKREKRIRFQDDIDYLIKEIEKFAPKKYKDERESFYYNYVTFGDYISPLSALLQVISQQRPKSGNEADFISELFMKLKDFYDPKEKLSLAEAISDHSLKKRLGQVLLIFYNKKDIKMVDIESYLAKLGLNPVR
ncbi:MAG: hypothetical protein SV375_10165 [Thermodesulfobacteriota bacterium]|nr:hypothetical protein [Thermodesulfobacteriota bacterium]